MKNTTPAVLFYPQDFLAGTGEMTMQERGAYITLLCYQNTHGHMSPDFIRRVVPRCPKYVLDKFEVDADGNYFNVRMDEEIRKRVKFSDSRRKNLGSDASHMKPHMDSHMDEHMDGQMTPHMGSHMETETEIYIDNISNNTKLTKKDNTNELCNEKEIDRGVGEGRGKTDLVQECVDAFNAVCKSLPKVQVINAERRRKVRERLKSFSPEEIRQVFEKVEESDFASGRTGRWRCSFDWLMHSDGNLIKALEGNYDNMKKMSSLDIAHREIQKELEEMGEEAAWETIF